jgi:hypothetical protein
MSSSAISYFNNAARASSRPSSSSSSSAALATGPFGASRRAGSRPTNEDDASATALPPGLSGEDGDGSGDGVEGSEDVTRLLVRLQRAEQQPVTVPELKEHCAVCNVSFFNFYEARAHCRTVAHRQKAADARRRAEEEATAKRAAEAPKPVHVREMFLKNAERKVRKLNAVRAGRAASAGAAPGPAGGGGGGGGGDGGGGGGGADGIATAAAAVAAGGPSTKKAQEAAAVAAAMAAPVEKMRASILRAAEALKAQPDQQQLLTPET